MTRDVAERARAELAARGAGVGAEAVDAVTPAEWLAAHRAEAAESDQHRRITEEHDLADIVEQRSVDLALTTPPSAGAETGLPDAREQRLRPMPDEHGRVPDSSDVAEAVRRAQAALREIAARRELDEREKEEARSRQLTDWADDDSRAEHADAHAAAQ